MNQLAIELSVSGNKGETFRAAIQPDIIMLEKAMQPVRTNDTAEGAFLEGVRPTENSSIEIAREELARDIADNIVCFLIDNLFAKNDTHNGYKKHER